MKKLVTACAACMLAGFVSAQVESVNIVGYQTMNAPGQFYSSGCTFVSVGSATGEWRLGDVTVSGMDPFSDIIQFLSTSTAFTEISATYIDLPTSIANAGDDSLVGWWDPNDLGGTSLMAQPFPAGSAFLGNFNSTSVMITFPNPVM